MLKEFKEFAMKGNVIDMAVGVVIGSAFSKIVSSLVSDIIMPILGILTSGINFSDKAFVLSYAEDGSVANSLNYGMFIQNVIDFFIIAFCIFLVVKGINELKKFTERNKKAEEEAKAPAGPTTEELLADIKALLEKKN